MPYSNDPHLDQRIRESADALARGGPLFVWGPVGSGKTHLVRALHRERSSGTPLLFQQAAGLDGSRFESQFFGHVRGAFSGAVSDFGGLVGAARGGVLCLEGIEGLRSENQAKILRFLQERTYRPLGGTLEHSWDGCLVITAQDSPETLRAEGRLREDFYFRVATVTLHLPALEKRVADFDQLCADLVSSIRAELDLPLRLPTTAERDDLRGRDMDGNLHGLRNLLQQAMIRGEVPSPSDTPGHEPSGLPDTGSLRDDLELLEAQLLERALSRDYPNREALARALGISRRTLLYKLEKHHLN